MIRATGISAGLVFIAALSASGGPIALTSATQPDPATDARLSELAETIVREAIPPTFEHTQHWERRKRVVNGLDVETRRGRLRISKRERDARHGFWRKYVVTLIDPQESLRLRVENFHSPEPGQFRWDVYVSVRANVDVRFEHWHYGVKLFNSNSNADATLEVHAGCSLNFTFETDETTKTPVVVLKPTIETIGVQLPDLNLNKLGGVSGPGIEELGDNIEGIVEGVMQSQEDRIRERAQKAIEKRSDDLRIPVSNLLSSPWSRLWLGL